MKAPALLLLLAGNSVFANFDGADNFNDNLKDPIKWGTDSISGVANFTEANQRLEYTSVSINESIARRPWILNSGSYDQDWSLTLNYLNTAAVGTGAGAAVSLRVYNAGNSSDFVSLDASRSQTGVGYYSALFSHTSLPVTPYTGLVFGAQDGSLRIDYDSLTKVITTFYDADAGNGYDWIRHASFGVDGSDGTTANSNWQMTTSDSFQVVVQANSWSVNVPSGAMFADNFTAVPEPQTISLFAAGVFALAGFHCFRVSSRRR